MGAIDRINAESQGPMSVVVAYQKSQTQHWLWTHDGGGRSHVPCRDDFGNIGQDLLRKEILS
jgi:hypothetical protein